MKKLILLSTVVISACFFAKLDTNKAKTVVEALIQKENSGDYKGMSQYYTNDFNDGESEESRAAKFKLLHDTFGDMTGMEATLLRDSTDLNELRCVNLIYKVKHAKGNTTEEFTVINDEGTYKVELHTINMDKQ